MRTIELELSNDMTVQHKLEPGKVIVLVLDGIQGKVKVTEAVEHGHTIIETAKGKVARVKFEESELF
ncbi:XtrA/YqaO family protein [Gottfriedia endophytica]|uniref:XtrA/YqaO family protein n=1 Tax=Gottfriedia endophytica TaxID=2820819 RepID=UPI0024755A1B